ncbi:MAG: TlpA family protein disulfide reductase [Candidatus Sumerlaeia bacterium]|nr:TlpA family protein disulfide reductase [Candidatus Sumerlaeia bacterium]
MKTARIVAPLLPILLLAAWLAGDTQPTAFPMPKPGEVPFLDQAGVEKLVATHGNRLLVVNHWATWCSPCVEELPYFQAAQDEFGRNGVQIVALSMDFHAYEDEWPDFTHPTVKEAGLMLPVFQLNIDTTVTVPWFSSKWQGALPATFFYDREGNKVGEILGELTREQLFVEIGRQLERTLPKKPAAP